MALEELPRNTPQIPGTSLREVREGIAHTAGEQSQDQALNMGPNGDSKREAADPQSGPPSSKNSTCAAPDATAHPNWREKSVPSFPGPHSFSGQTPWPPSLPSAAAPGATRSIAMSQGHRDPQLGETPKRLSPPLSSTSSTGSGRPGALWSTWAQLQGGGREPPLEVAVREDQGRQFRGEKKPWEGMEGLAALDDIDWGPHGCFPHPAGSTRSRSKSQSQSRGRSRSRKNDTAAGSVPSQL